ncbi:PaaI family thioesterase [Nocardiopsis composta]|uniref:Acyl-coenzyme A thioesterase THEM4 n=1 Tax=Nocardiopsis composta TaxID=157465 RepID=A0A7W8QSN5_9ACTN|nr:PaaI family thioesterase [Nocardiopsis composta]MBB5435814.1 acyl-coenzyme A thioesterase PaaI-like protein [Nocardiopsis composta]
MTVDAQPVTELPDPADYGFTVVPEEEIPAELASLVERVRSLMDAAAHTEAPPEALAAAADAVAKAEELIQGGRRQLGAMVRYTYPDGSIEYGTITNGVSGPVNPLAPPLLLEKDGEGGIRGEVLLNGLYQGPPGLVHGGWLAALLDQALGTASSVAGMPGLTANLDVNYRDPTPLNVPLEISARVTGTERRKVFVSGEIRHGGKVTAEGTAIMVRLSLPE